jgi:hypothetical protein
MKQPPYYPHHHERGLPSPGGIYALSPWWGLRSSTAGLLVCEIFDCEGIAFPQFTHVRPNPHAGSWKLSLNTKAKLL